MGIWNGAFKVEFITQMGGAFMAIVACCAVAQAIV